MKVKELISKLQEMPQNLPVTVYSNGGEADFMDIMQVSVEKAYANSTDTIQTVVISG